MVTQRTEIPEDYRKIARSNKRKLIKALLTLPYNEKQLGYMVTRRAQELKILSEDKAVIRGKTLVAWAETDSFTEQIPKEWGCVAAVNLMLESKKAWKFDDDDFYWAMVYYLSPKDDLDVLRQSKAVIDQYIQSFS